MWPSHLAAAAGRRSAVLLALELRNTSESIAFTHVSISKPQVGADQALIPFPPVTYLPPMATCVVLLALDLHGSRAPVRFHLSTDKGAFPVEVRPPQGELLAPAPLALEAFETLQARWGGMHQSTATLPARADAPASDRRVLAAAALQQVEQQLLLHVRLGAKGLRLQERRLHPVGAQSAVALQPH